MIETFFMVMSDIPDRAPPRVRHNSLDAAKREARRLADANPGERFFVLASLGHMIRNDPVSWQKHDDVPF